MKTGLSHYRFAGILLVTLLAPPVIGAQPYTWVDEDGERHFGDQPPAGKQAERVDMSAGNVSFIGDGNATEAESGNVEDEAAGDDDDAKTDHGVVDKAHQQELCEQATKNREAMNYGGIIRQTQTNGEVIVLTPEQKQEQRDLADEIIEAYCTD